MNFTFEQIWEYKKIITKNKAYQNLILCPAYCYLPIMHSSKYQIGAQDVSENEEGSFTGQVSASMLKSIDTSCVLINHYELHDSKNIVVQKIKNCLKEKLAVFIFISESKEEHDYQYSVPKMLELISFFLSQIKRSNYSYISFVYEPNWLIGQNSSLPKEEIKKIINHLKAECLKKYNYQFPILYGGGLTKESFLSLYPIPEIDGFVFGNLSLNAQNLVNLLEKVQ